MLKTNAIDEAKDKQKIISDAIKNIIFALGEDISRKGLNNTPLRVAKSLLYLTEGNGYTPLDVAGDALFPCESGGMILQKDIEFFSLCEHHLLPFFGHVHLAYLPQDKIIGLSKIGRIIDIFAKRLQVQENLTYQIAQAIHKLLKPKGVAITIEANHFCMMMRGIKKQKAMAVTSEFTGIFKNDGELRNEFFLNIKK
jgi:GTP cyclohydrolase IA